MAVRPGLTYTEETYPTIAGNGRRDDVWTGSAGIVYVYNTYANVSLTYSLNDDSSNGADVTIRIPE